MADGGMSTIQVIGTLVGGGAITAAGAWLLSAWKQRAEIRSKDRSDTFDHWAGLARQQEDKIAIINRQYFEREQQIDNRIAGLNKQTAMREQELTAQLDSLRQRIERDEDKNDRVIDELRNRHVKCEVENERLRSELRLMRLQMAQQSGSPSWVQTADTWDSGVVVADEAGTILDINPAAGLMLHYDRSELIGKAISEIMPRRYKELHDRGWRGMIERGAPPDPARVISGCMLTKDNREIMVSMQLHAWKSSGKWICGAKFRPRFTPDALDPDPFADPAEVAPAPAPIPVVVVNTPVPVIPPIPEVHPLDIDPGDPP